MDTDLSAQVLEITEVAIEGTCNLETDYVVAGVVTPRPTTGLVATTRAINVDLVKTGLPVGTVVFVDDIQAGVLTDTTLTIAFPVAGIWQLRVEPPFPALGSSCEITVT